MINNFNCEIQASKSNDEEDIKEEYKERTFENLY